MCIFQSEQLWFWLKNNLTDIQISVHWIIVCGARSWDGIRNVCQNQPTVPSWRLPWYEEFIDKTIRNFEKKRLRLCVAAAGGHFEHSV